MTRQLPQVKDERKIVVAEARKRFEKRRLTAYFKELYNERKARAQEHFQDYSDGQIINGTQQKVFGAKSSYKTWIATAHPDIAAAPVWAKITMQKLFPDELQPCYIHKEKHRSKRKTCAIFEIACLYDFHNNMIAYALELADRIDAGVANNITLPIDVVMPLAAPIMYSLVIRMQCLAFGRENFEFANGVCHQIHTYPLDLGPP